MKIIFLHGSGQKASSWNKTISYMKDSSGMEILCPELSELLNDKPVRYAELCTSFAEYFSKVDHPEKVRSLILIGTPHKVPKAAFAFQNLIFRFLPASVFNGMAFDKKGTFALGESMKDLDFSRRVSNVCCPSLIICGEKDRANIKSARYFSEHIPSSELKIFDKAGHIINEEEPERLAMELIRFYDKI